MHFILRPLLTGFFGFLLFQDLPAQVKPAHPRLFITPAVITQLQNRALANTPEWQEVQDRLSTVSSYDASEIMDIVYEGQEYAFMYALSYYATGNTADRDSAVSIFTELFNNYTTDSSMYWDSGYESRSTLFEVAVLYDWLYNDLGEPFRTNVRTRLINWCDFLMDHSSTYGMWGFPYYFEGNNYTMGHWTGITATGYAVHSEDAVNGNRLIAVSDSLLPFMLNFANTRLSGGDANEGWGYGAGYALSFFRTLAMIKTATVAGTDHFANTTYDEDVMKFLPHATLPNLTHMLAEGDWARESTGELWDYHRMVADIVSSYSNNATTQRIALFWANETVPLNHFAVTSYRWYPFLFSNTSIAPLDYRTQADYTAMSIYTDTSGTDQFIRRTGWNSTAQWVSYRGGGRYGDHAHNGSGHFSVFDNGWLLIDKNIQSSSGIEGSDSMHNNIHFEAMNNDELYPFADDYNQAEHTLGKRRDLNTEYSYLWTVATPIYTARNSYFNVVSQSERQFLYLPQLKKIALFDLTETNDIDYGKSFGVHYASNASISSDSVYTFYSNGTRKAAVHTCYPLEKSVSVNGQTVHVRNKTSQQKDYFMHLVSVQNTADAIVNVLPVNRENGRVLVSDFYGSFHAEASKNYCILFAGDDPAFNYDSLVYEVPATQTLHNYIAGLDPAVNYYVSSSFPWPGTIRIKVSVNNHAGSAPFMSSTGGVLSFELTEMTGVNENTVLNWMNIYYNGAQETICIEDHSGQAETQVKLFDASGKMVLQQTNAESKVSIPTTSLAKGVYMVQVSRGENRMSKKIAVY